MPSFETPANVFTRLPVFDSPKGSSDTFKTPKYQPVFREKMPNNIYIHVNTNHRMEISLIRL